MHRSSMSVFHQCGSRTRYSGIRDVTQQTRCDLDVSPPGIVGPEHCTNLTATEK